MLILKSHITYLIDVYATSDEGHYRHLGGGYFTATTQAEAERLALKDFWQNDWLKYGFEPSLNVDIEGKKGQPPSANKLTHRLIVLSDTLIPFS